MNWLEFTASIVKAVAWPAVFLIIFFALREPVRKLLPLLQKFKYKEVELEFTRRVEEVSAELAEGLPTLQSNVAGNADEIAIVAKLADVSPRAAVLESWLSIETAALSAARRLGWEPPSEKPTNGLSVMKFLEHHNSVDRKMVGLLRELRSLRNQAAHTPEFALSKGAALEYGSTATRVANYLRELVN